MASPHLSCTPRKDPAAQRLARQPQPWRLAGESLEQNSFQKEGRQGTGEGRLVGLREAGREAPPRSLCPPRAASPSQCSRRDVTSHRSPRARPALDNSSRSTSSGFPCSHQEALCSGAQCGFVPAWRQRRKPDTALGCTCAFIRANLSGDWLEGPELVPQLPQASVSTAAGFPGPQKREPVPENATGCTEGGTTGRPHWRAKGLAAGMRLWAGSVGCHSQDRMQP